jgi:hypothetical protein
MKDRIRNKMTICECVRKGTKRGREREKKEKE